MGAKTRRERARGLLTHLAALIARGRVKELLAPFSARDSNRPVIEQFLRRILAAGVESIAFDLIDLQDEEASRFTVVAGCRFTLRGYGPHWYLWSFTLDDSDHAVHKARFSMACDPRDLRPDFVPADLGWDAGAETRAAWAGRHQEAAAAAQDPHSVVEYARASEKRLRFLLTNPRLVPAVIIANMMSSRVARVAAQIYDPRPEPMLKSLFNYHAHQITHLEDHPDPETATVSFNGATYPTFDEMAGYFPRDGHAFGLCGSLALFNFAALRLAGVPADELLLVGLRSPYAMHELVLWRRAKARREESYVFDNSFWQRWNPQRFYEMTEVYRWCNDRAWGAESGTNLDARGVVSLCERFGGAFPQFRLPAVPAAQPARLSQPAPATAGLDIAGLDIAAVPDPDQLAARMKERVFRLSATCPDSLYTYAKYAYQTLMVSFPEAYALRSLECPVARRALAGLPTPEAARDWLRAEAVHASIFFEADRLMTADQVVLYRAADDKSRALFLWAWFALHGRDAVWLMTDQAAYVLVDGPGGGRGARQCWHGGTLQPVPHWAGDPILAMNERAAYYPAFGRNDLAGDLRPDPRADRRAGPRAGPRAAGLAAPARPAGDAG